MYHLSSLTPTTAWNTLVTQTPVVRVIMPGDTSKENPFTICIVANPALEAPWKSGHFVRDPINEAQADFDAAVEYVARVLFGRLPNQAETFLGEPGVAPGIRMLSLWTPGLEAAAENALVGEDESSDLLVSRRAAFIPFLQRYGLSADVVYAISSSQSHVRASAWPASDDDARPGVPFSLDGRTLHHRFHARIPGTVALHTNSSSITALHEFGHALSSYSNGQIVDLYVDGPPGVNNKRGRPIPARFAVYQGTDLATDPTRNGLGYPDDWRSYHPALHDAAFPAVMDDYWQAPDGVPEHCRHDQLTRRFLLDRVRAKQER